MTRFSPELFTTICERIAEGESLRAVCRDDDMPAAKTFQHWMDIEGKQKLGTQYTRACSDRAEKIFEECLTIADDTSQDVNDRRISVDTRKWMVGKMQPKKYGERIQQDIGGDGFKVIIGDKDAGGL